MLIPSKLLEILKTQINEYVKSVFICDAHGRIECHTGDYLESKHIAAMVDNAMFVYNKYGNPLNLSAKTVGSGAHSLLIENETSHLAVVKAGPFLVCFVATAETDIDYLQAKTASFAKGFADVLNN
jgi:hypothetical protein